MTRNRFLGERRPEIQCLIESAAGPVYYHHRNTLAQCGVLDASTGSLYDLTARGSAQARHIDIMTIGSVDDAGTDEHQGDDDEQDGAHRHFPGYCHGVMSSNLASANQTASAITVSRIPVVSLLVLEACANLQRRPNRYREQIDSSWMCPHGNDTRTQAGAPGVIEVRIKSGCAMADFGAGRSRGRLNMRSVGYR